ncbi:MAG: molybdopterin cofactor-binding domain-containing protein [Bauldia litoralis]
MTSDTHDTHDGPTRGPALPLSRRGFLALGGGLSVAVAAGAAGVAVLSPAAAKAAGRPIGAWVRIAPDDAVTIVTPAAEMGQGSMTGVPVALAEELDVDWNKVTLEMAPADPSVYGYGGYSMAIVGSRAIRSYFSDMRIAGAQVRKLLVTAAAAKWGVTAADVTTEPGVAVHAATGRRLRYGEIAAFAEVPPTLPPVSPGELKTPDRFRILGKAVPRRDIPEKVDGSAKYSIDVQLPGMVYASVVHSPEQNAQPRGWNEDAVRKLPGVVALHKLPSGVAVVADTWEHVLAARRELQIEWTKGSAAGFDSEAALGAEYASIARRHAAGNRGRGGDVEAAFKAAARVHKAEFRSDYGYHAQMEPLNAVARFNAAGDQLEIWEGTQAPGWSRQRIASAFGLPVARVIHHQHYLGGGFGRRSTSDYTIEAARIARAVKRPVKMIWTREEDLARGMFRPQNLQCVEAALDKAGKLAGWRHCVVGDGGGLITSGINLEKYYRIPAVGIETRGVSHGIRLKHWRAVAHPFNIFAIEGLVDEMAAKERIDPFEFRRQRMSLTPRARWLFDKVEAMANWKGARPAGRALGVAVSERSGSLGAGVVEISLDRKTGRIRVHEVWMAVDGGTIVQPDMARANIESGIVYGLSSVLKERVTIRDGAVQQTNFHDYELLRMSEAPEAIHIEFAPSRAAPAGLGEIGNPFIAAAVANAFAALTGKRLYHMPFTPERVQAALKA